MRIATPAACAVAVVAGCYLAEGATGARPPEAKIGLTFLPSATAPAGTSVVMPIRLTNGWTGKAIGVTLTVTAPTWVKVSSPGCTYRRGTLRCALGDLAGGAKRIVRITVKPMRVGTYRVSALVTVKKVLSPIENSTRAPAAHGRFRWVVAPISGTLARRMTGVSWRSGCPVGLRDLRTVNVSFWGFDGGVHNGTLIVHRAVAAPVVRIMKRLFAARFPIRRIVPVDTYGADDFRSIQADNTSAFNCRPVAGTSRWSEHAYGRAIDLDPLENPYVSDGKTSHAGSRRYLDRSLRLPGVIHAGDAVVKAFAAEGWGWGGTWSGTRDYQHFSASGR